MKLKAAEDKASVFEKQLDLAQRRLDGLTTSGQTDPYSQRSHVHPLLHAWHSRCSLLRWPSGTASAIAANEAAEKEMEVQRLNAELESTQVRWRGMGARLSGGLACGAL